MSDNDTKTLDPNAELAAFKGKLSLGVPFIYEMTPTLCALLLQTANVRNRDRSPSKLEDFKVVMENHGWELNGESLKFAPNGDLIDGQHRCSACMLSGCSFQTWIMPNIAPATVRTMDTGLVRTGVSHLQLLRYDDPKLLDKAIVMIINFEARGSFTGKAPSNRVIEEFAAARGPAITENINAVKSVLDDSEYAPRIPMLAVVRYQLALVSPTLVPYFDHEWVQAISNGQWDSENDPTAVVARLLLAGGKPAQKRINDSGRIGVLLTAMVSHRQGKKAAGLANKASHRFSSNEFAKLFDQLSALAPQPIAAAAQ